MKYLSTILIITLLVSVFAIFPVSAKNGDVTTSLTADYQKISIEATSVVEVTVKPLSYLAEYDLQTKDKEKINIIVEYLTQLRLTPIEPPEGSAGWSLITTLTFSDGSQAIYNHYGNKWLIVNDKWYEMEYEQAENFAGIVSILVGKTETLTPAPEPTPVKPTLEPTTLAKFLQLDPGNTTSITLRKVHTGGHDVKTTGNKELISKFFEIANATTMTPCEKHDSIAWDGGMYIEVTPGAYAFISMDGGVDAYMVAMSRAPWSVYRIDDEAKTNEILLDFFNSFDNNISEWAKFDIDNAIMQGLCPAGFFDDYGANITREQFCDLAFKLLEKTKGLKWHTTTVISFDDTSNMSVSTLKQIGVIEGKGGRIFAPNDLLTREEAATILYRIHQYLGIHGIDYMTMSFRFYDDDKISEWAKNGVYNMKNADIMNGDENGLFAPQDNYTVEQAIVTVLRLYRKYQEKDFYYLFGRYDVTLNATGSINATPGINNMLGGATAEKKDNSILLNIQSSKLSEVQAKIAVSDVKIVGYDGELDVKVSKATGGEMISYTVEISGAFSLDVNNPPELLVIFKDNDSGETQTVNIKCVIGIVW